MFVPLHHQAPYRNLHDGENFKNSNNISKKGICLPSSPNLTDDEFLYIVNTIKRYIKINS